MLFPFSVEHTPMNEIMAEALEEAGIPFGDLNGEREDEGTFAPGKTQERKREGKRSWNLQLCISSTKPLIQAFISYVITKPSRF